jgi:hypothetical protein
MSIFEQVGVVAIRAQEQGLLAPALGERIVNIASNYMYYKHLGLELHGLLAQLTPAADSGQRMAADAVEAQLQRIEARHRGF